MRPKKEEGIMKIGRRGKSVGGMKGKEGEEGGGSNENKEKEKNQKGNSLLSYLIVFLFFF
jgi:hypothetical protein